MSSSKQDFLVFKNMFFFLNIPKTIMKREKMFPFELFDHHLEILVIDTHNMCIKHLI